uniref:Cytochrome c oxidase assembly protein COX20, mitochondrial n=1 Tax=Rousettus aegyptiacus TaxID=9407 RepID=A0A7J8B921_ROUAE|nr:cytochrome c oxidase assembly factor COX20 [Rousettus aegyptiacus]
MAAAPEPGEPDGGKILLEASNKKEEFHLLNQPGKDSGERQRVLSSTPSKPFKLLGILDVENIPCARDSILYGSIGSVVAGLGHFLLTSRIRRSCDVGVGGFILVTLGCWFHCRYNYAKLRIQERIAREGIKNKILYESTHLDPERKQTNGDSGN